MDRSKVVCLFSIVLLVLQSTQGADLNSEATLNCNGKEFKCINATHYQPCSLTERTGQQPQYTINGVVLPCATGKSCDEASSFGCTGVARTAQPVDQPSQIPVEVTIVEEPVKVVAPVAAAVEQVAAPAKSLPVEDVATNNVVPAPVPVAVAPVAVEETKSAEAAAAPAPTATPAKENVTDATKADEEKPKKKFSFKGLKKVGPIRLVKGFRAATWRPKISLDSQKDVADSLRKRIFERRNKYEKFVDNVLGKASPTATTSIAVETKPDAKQPAPGAPIQHDPIDLCEDDGSCGDDYDSCEDGSSDCDGDDDSASDDDSSSSSCDSSSGSDSDSGSDSCESDSSSSDDDDDCSDEDELEPGEGEAVWEEEEVEGGIEIVEECPDDEDDCDDDSCDSEDSDYEYEDGVEETAVVNRPDDDDCESSESCESDSSSSSSSDDDDDCDDDSCSDEDDSCADDDDECKKKRKQANKDKKKKKKSGSKNKKSGNKKSAVKAADKPDEKATEGKKAEAKAEAVQKKKPTEKKKVRYPPVQKIRKSLMRAFANVTEAISTPAKKRNVGRKGGSGGGAGGVIGNAASGLQNAVLNKVDGLLSIKDNGLFNKNKGGNSDDNTGCSIVEGWSCPRQGRYAHPIDCQKYVQCAKTGPFSKTLQNTVYECEDDEAYDPNIRSCTTDWSSCEALEQCLYHRQLIEDPSDDNSYFICIRDGKKFKESYDLYRRDCTPGRIFDPDYQLCMESNDYRRVNKEKRRRQQIKKQKQCQKKKAQKKNKKKKSPQKKH